MTLETILTLERVGFSVLVCRERSKHPLANWKQYQKRRAKPDEIKQWHRQHPKANWAVITGPISDLVVIDTDNPEAERYAQERGLPPTLTVKTGKGRHYYYTCPNGTTIGNKAGLHGIAGLDIRGEGGYVICPPSIHPNGKRYECERPLETPLAPLPVWVYEPATNGHREASYLEAAIKGKLDDACQRVAQAQDGTKHETLRKAANMVGGYLHTGVLTEHEIISALMHALPATVQDRGAAERTIKDGLVWGRDHPLEQPAPPEPPPTNGHHPATAPPAPPAGPPDDDDDEPPDKEEGRLLHTDDSTYVLPPGTFFIRGAVWRGEHPLYMGKMWVAETGTNVHSQEQTALVRWNGHGSGGNVVALRSDLASQAGVTKVVGGAGGAIHAGNARNMSRYLVEFIQQNRQTIPHVQHSEYYGNVEGGLILPAGSIKTQTRYIGKPIEVGSDQQLYSSILRSVVRWATPVFWATFALAVSAPLYARLKDRIDRNPVLHLGGASGSGKTTIAHFGTGAYGDPRLTPLQVQCGSGTTTPKGMGTALVEANGLPVLFDDVHKMLERKKQETEGLIYDFANGQYRSYGTPGNRKTGGGQAIRGVLITAGETSLNFLNAGSNNRVFSFDCNMYPPLGCGAKSAEGMARARVLNAAWLEGAGTFGYQLCEEVLHHWREYSQQIRAFERDPALEPLQAWRKLLAIAAATLQMAAMVAGIEDLDLDRLLRQWSDILQESNQERDPAHEAWERVRLLFVQAERSQDRPATAIPNWHYLHIDRKLVAVKREGEGHWRVLHTSPEWKSYVGENALEMFGPHWLQQGWLIPHKNGNISHSTWVGNGAPRCVLVADDAIYPPGMELEDNEQEA
jgi:hypothetical protein